ncbi:MAG: vWA domain-containing protein [Bacteroidota bacterium]|nr:vWA domain-containing protein [Bacteroidota bacterium]
MRKSPLLWLLLLLSLPASPVVGQISFTASKPIVDSFPIVRIPVSVTENNQPAQSITSANFTVKEDGVLQSPLDLSGCSGSTSAAICFVVDTSRSMEQSVGSGPQTNRNYQKFFDAFSGFIASIPAPSQLALVEFAVAASPWPGPTKWFYYSNNPTDVQSFMNDLMGGFPPSLFSTTNVDSGIDMGVTVLLHSTIQRRIMILVTDDSPDQADSIRRYLAANGISLYFMDVNPSDSNLKMTNYTGKDLADGTGGAYFQAYDSTLYLPTMLAISHLIFGERCMLRYVSANPCAWWKSHTVEVNLNYNGATPRASFDFELGGSTNDKNPPTYKVDATMFTKRILTTYDPWPCESGMRLFIDDSLRNFRHPRLPVVTSDSATDSLIVIDSLQPADGYFTATDSLGNKSYIHVHYDPKPDVLPPVIEPAQWVGGGVVTMKITEQRAWDRGIQSVTLQPGAVNLVLDSVHYLTNRYAVAYLRMPKLGDPTSGCLIAVDSFKNSSTLCYSYGETGGDTLPPLFVQDPVAIPRGVLSGIVTELRPGDRGLQRVQLTPIINSQTPSVTFSSAQKAIVQVTITDTLYSARTLVEAWDSVGNFMRDTMRYDPQPDSYSPVITSTSPASLTYDFSATEVRAWDRGLRSVTFLPTSTNSTATLASFTDKWHASLTATVSDKTLNATMIVEAVDSIGHGAYDTLIYTGVSTRLLPLGDSVINFGNQVLPGSMQRQVVMTNPNDVPISLTLTPLTGDDSVFSIITASPITFAARGQHALVFDFHPRWLGAWRAVTTLMSDTAHLGSVTLLGTSSGTFSIKLDTVIVPHVGESGALVFSIDAEPKPINLDSIQFTVSYDADFVTLKDFVNCPAGGPDTGICLYDTKWTGGTDGNRIATLARNTRGLASSLSLDRSQISIPFTTIVAPHDSTAVHFASATANYSTLVTAADGFISAGDTCGTGLYRSEMNGSLELRIEPARPNPASSSMDVTVHSAAETDATISFISVVGSIEKSIPVHLSRGDQTVHLADLPASSGVFELSIKAAGMNEARQRVEILR